jgi:hypothetical protein
MNNSLSKKQQKKRAREEEAQQRLQQAAAANGVTMDQQLCSADFRAQERDRIKALYAGTVEMGGGQRPTLSLVQELLERNQALLKAQDELRKSNGTLPYDTFSRRDPIGSLAREANGYGDAAEAAKKIYPMLVHIWDYRNAMVGTDAERANGREQSLHPEEAAIGPAPWPKGSTPDIPGGYNRFRKAIDGACNEKEEFYAWAAEEIDDGNGNLTPLIPFAKLFLPKGDIVMPPLFIAGEARKSKSQPTIAFASLAMRIPNVKVLISVAPNKIGPLTELNDKIRKTGLVEAGAFTMGTTLNNPLTDDAVAQLCESNLLTYSHEEKGDVLAAKQFVKDARARGYAVVMIHDEAHSLVKRIEKEEFEEDNPNPDKEDKDKKIVELLRELFSLSMTRTVLVGATLVPTLHEPSIWGSTLLEDAGNHASDLCDEGLLERPLEPSDKGAQYLGISDLTKAFYDDKADPNDPCAFTRENTMNRMRENRPECIRVCTESAKSWEAALTAKGAKPRKVKGVEQTQEQANATYAHRLKKAKEDVKTAEKANVNDPFPYDKIPKKYPSMPDGCTKLYRDEVATALLTCHTGAYIAKSPSTPVQKARTNDPEDHHICNTYLVSCTQTQQTNDRDVVGGLAGFTRFCTDELKRQQKPGVVMLYSSINNGSIARSTNIEFRKGTRGGEKNPVKLFVVLPITTGTDANGDPEVEWQALPFSSHPGAAEALRQAHQLCADNNVRNLVPSLRVIQVGYDMFKASTTLAVSDLCHEFSPGVMERLHYVASSMVLCHSKDKQLDVLYQMVGRAMNLFIAIKLPGFKVEVLSHAQTLNRTKCYYHIEKYMVDCMKGKHGTESRHPDKMMGALLEFAEEQTGEYNMDVEEFLSKGKIGLRRKSIGQTLAVGNKANGGDLVRRSDIFKPEEEEEDVESEEEEEEEDADSMDVDGDASGLIKVLYEIYKWKHSIGRPDLLTSIVGPHYKMDSDDEAHRASFVSQLTQLERDALAKVPKYNQANGKKTSDGKAEFYNHKYMNQYPDLINRVLPAWFAMYWKLYVHKQYDDFPNATEAARVDRAKETAWKNFERCWGALSYLICTRQICPSNKPNLSAWEFLTDFTNELGNEVGLRREALNHMLRGLKWNTDRPTNHPNHVTALLDMLERLRQFNDPVVLPWKLPPLGHVPAWHTATHAKNRHSIKVNCVCGGEYEELEMGPGSEMEHLALYDYH